MGATSYSADFFAAREDGSRRSAEAILPIVLGIVDARSAVDVGCGSGTWTQVLRRHMDDVVGIDGDWVPGASRGPWFSPRDLQMPLRMERRFDLAISMEVAEHLPPSRADSFVADLAALAPAILFSAAIPGQGGTDHRNEQWQSYWAERFRIHNLYPHDVVRPPIWDNSEVQWWYVQNTLLYLRDPAPPSPLDLVHPRAYTAALERR